MLGIHETLRLRDALEGEIILVPSWKWLALRAEGGYHEAEPWRAIWILGRFLNGNPGQARGFMAETRLLPHERTYGFARMDDGEILSTIIHAIETRQIIAIRKGAGPSHASQRRGNSTQLHRLVERADGGKLSFRGRQYRLLVADDLGRLDHRDRYQVLPQADARAVLAEMAKESPASSDVLRQASENIGKDWHSAFSQPDGLLLLRWLPPAASTPKRDDGPAITPSQMKALKEDVEEPTIRLVSIEAPVFVPGQETNRISYAIDGPVAKAASVVMVVESVPPKGAPAVVGTIAIAGPYSASGAIDWDGKVGTSAGVITLKGSPYHVSFELTSTSGKKSTSDPGEIRLEVHAIAIVVEADAGVDDASARAIKGLVAELDKSGMPGDCAGRLIIRSPIFKTTSGEMNTSASFDEYKRAVGTGPAVPLRARIELKSKAGGGKRSPPALDGTRILWDFKLEMSADLDGSLSGRGVHAQAKTFIKHVASYQESLTRPKGVSVHAKLGGWRASLADRDSAGWQWRDRDDWALAPPSKRKWAALTLCEGEEGAPADSGVKFYPGRMAGDLHRIRAFVDVDDSLDVEDEASPYGAPAPRRSNTIAITTWRQVPLVGNWIVGATTSPVDLPSLATEYKQAGMLVEADPPGPPRDVSAEWQKAYEIVVDGYRAYSGSDPEIKFVKDALERTANGFPVRYSDFMDYWERINTNAGFFGKLWERIRNFFGAGDEARYKRRCHKRALVIALKTSERLSLPSNGITALKFGCFGPHNQIPNEEGVKITVGIAPDTRGLTGRNKAMFLQFTPSKGTDTFVHEVGHTLFLAHAPGHWEPGEQPDGYQVNAHDKNQICIMSYHPAARHLCGLCLEKLAGLNYVKMGNDGTIEE